MIKTYLIKIVNCDDVEDINWYNGEMRFSTTKANARRYKSKKAAEAILQRLQKVIDTSHVNLIIQVEHEKR